MRKSIKITLYFLLSIVVVLLGAFIFYLSITNSVNLDKKYLLSINKSINYYDSNGENFSSVNGKDVECVKVSQIYPTHLKNAFISTEDRRFYQHKGVDYKSILRATINNVKSLSFKEGGSTISQQLIKNTHLSNDKTIKRKLVEIKLAKQLEKEFTKDEILSMYLQSIYFGENCFGIYNASNFYFSVSPDKLNLNQCALLAGLVKAPSHYSPLVNYDRCLKRRNVVLKNMFDCGFISEKEYLINKDKEIELNVNQNKYDFKYLASKELSKIIEENNLIAKTYNVYTSFSKHNQQILNNEINSVNIDCEKSSILLDKSNRILAYSSTCGDIKRQVGSTIKPLLVYAPAIQNNVVYPCSIIKDEKTDFSGYSPSNYNDIYYGNITIKEAFEKSSNVCAVKLLNYTGVEKSKNYLKKMGFELNDKDNSLSLALGSTLNGEKLSNLVGCYNVFLNSGNYKKQTCIDKITNENGMIIYKRNENNIKIFDEDTVSVINQYANGTTKTGTAKKLSPISYSVYAKTGTVGNKNGNTDAYCISYTSENLLGVWIGNKGDEMLTNNVTGGTTPTIVNKNILDKLYYSFTPEPIKEKGISTCWVDKFSLGDGSIELADENTPSEYKIECIFKSSHIPKVYSSRFLSPKIQNANISVNNKGIQIGLCVAQYYDFYIYKSINGKKYLFYDSLIDGKKENILDFDIERDKTYEYSIIPYIKANNKIIKGEEYKLNKIKTPSKLPGEKWWENQFD